MANCASHPAPTRVSGQAMIPALSIIRSIGPARRDEPVGEPGDAVEVAEVELVHLDAVDAGQRLLGDRRAAGGHDDVGAGAGEGAGRLDADARVAAGDDGEPVPSDRCRTTTSAAVEVAPKPEPMGCWAEGIVPPYETWRRRAGGW